MIVAPPEAPAAAVDDPGAPASGTAAEQAGIRLRELFRLWLRDGHVHPLIHLMQRYRSDEEP